MDQLLNCAFMGLLVSLSSQCTTDSCICQSQNLLLMFNPMSIGVDGYFSSNNNDATSAMYAVISYCTAHSYTAPSSLSSITTSPGKPDVVVFAYMNGP